MFFTITDAPKVSVPLAELADAGALPAARPLRITDLGAGCGAMTLGVIGAMRELGDDRALEVIAIDRDAAALEVARAAIQDYTGRSGTSTRFATRVEDATRAPLPAADLVLIGTMLNELAPDAALGVTERAIASLSQDGALVVIEPALRPTSRALHALRDHVIERGIAHVFAPCTRAVAPCPALADPDDWCHEDRPVELGPRTRELARLTHLRDRGLKFSYLVLRRMAGVVGGDPRGLRIVSAVHAQKGKSEAVGCGRYGWVPVRLLKRNRSAATRAFVEAARGDVVRVDAEPEAGRLDLAPDAALTIYRARRSPG